MNLFIVIMGASAAFIGLCPAIDNDEGVICASTGLAGCGVAAMLAVVAAQVMP